MKARLSSTVWLLVLWISAAAIRSPGARLLRRHAFGRRNRRMPLRRREARAARCSARARSPSVACISIVCVLSKRVLKPVDELAKFSERIVAGDVARARGD